jgi:ER-bound oxygenase mpaB/B'/Rubber oxygenase, catalytic domain
MSVANKWPEKAAWAADPLADSTVAALVGPWPAGDAVLGPAGQRNVALTNQLMATWGANATLPHWQASADTPPELARWLQDYLQQGAALPEWADRAKVERAEDIFIMHGPLSCTLLFCASLPECYVLPNLADVLHIAGQLEAHTEHRIRQTAAMIFPVMMQGGLMGGNGQGIAQVLKVRLIHATIRHLILRGSPAHIRGLVPARQGQEPAMGMHDALMRHGWNVDTQGLPCNQLELAYTLLTFGYVFLKGLRTMGQGLSTRDEEAYLHVWNVLGHVLGIRADLMAHTMDDAAKLFDHMQAQARRQPPKPDVRPPLGHALMSTLERSLAVPVVRGLPVVLTQWLVGTQTAQDIGLSQRAPLLTRILFVVLRGLVSCLDTIGRWFTPRFCLSRLLTRTLGYHLLTKLLLDQTRPLALPEQVLQNIHSTVVQWSDDPQALGWMNRLEDHLTTQGPWCATSRTMSKPLSK